MREMVSTPALARPHTSKFMRVRDWRAQTRAETDAQFVEEQHVYASDLVCDGCDIHIGKDYQEQELYLYPVWQEQGVRLANGQRDFDRLAILQLCGDCAERRQLSQDLQVFDHTIWRSTNYISTFQVRQVAKRFREQVACVCWLTWFFLRPGRYLPPWHFLVQIISPLEVIKITAPARQPRQPRSTGIALPPVKLPGSFLASLGLGSILDQYRAVP